MENSMVAKQVDIIKEGVNIIMEELDMIKEEVNIINLAGYKEVIINMEPILIIQTNLKLVIHILN